MGPYWLPRRHYQSSQQAILVVQVPVRATLKHKKFDQPNVMHSLKNRAQRQRDYNRRQTFLEQKNFCAMPFYGLEGQEFTKEIQNCAEENKLILKLRNSSETPLKKAQTSGTGDTA